MSQGRQRPGNEPVIAVGEALGTGLGAELVWLQRVKDLGLGSMIGMLVSEAIWELNGTSPWGR
jgi:hypothetical protein